MYIPRPAILLFQINNGWGKILTKHGDAIPEWTQLVAERMLACGMKVTGQWIAEQQHILPNCEWQHITFTMPDKLWLLFANNWPLLNQLFSCAANTLLKWTKKLGVEMGLFVALHTYGRQLNRHPHIHLSVTRGGIYLKHGV